MKETGNAGQVVSVYLKDGKESKGKKVFKVCNVAVLAGEDLGSAKSSIEVESWSAPNVSKQMKLIFGLLLLIFQLLFQK